MICYVYKVRPGSFVSKKDNKEHKGYNVGLLGRFGGGGRDSVLTYGVYDSFQKSVVGVPFFSSVPFLGLLFQHETTDKIKSFFVISVNKIDRE